MSMAQEQSIAQLTLFDQCACPALSFGLEFSSDLDRHFLHYPKAGIWSKKGLK